MCEAGLYQSGKEKKWPSQLGELLLGYTIVISAAQAQAHTDVTWLVLALGLTPSAPPGHAVRCSC